MKQILFHIGTPKTGSSAIQIFLARNRQALLSHSVDYLPIGEFAMGRDGHISSGNGAYLSRCVLPMQAPAFMKAPAAHFAEFYQALEKSNAEAAIISSELFSYADSGAFAALLAAIAERGIRVKCFYYIRTQIQFLCSGYMQQVKRHGCTDDPATNISRSYRQISFLRYHSFFQKNQNLFGKDQVICRLYEEATKDPRGLFDTLLASVLPNGAKGLNYDVRDVNTSMSPREVALMRELNQFKPRMKFSDMVVQNAIQSGKGASGSIHNLLSGELTSEIEQYFADENTKLAKEYFGREQLFPASPQMTDTPDSVSLETISPKDLISFFGGLLIRLDERIAQLEKKQATGGE